MREIPEGFHNVVLSGKGGAPTRSAPTTAPRNASQDEAGTQDRYIKVTWRDDGQHVVEIVGFRRRYEVQRLLRAVQRHAFSCQMRGLPLDSSTQRPATGETDESPQTGRGDS